jgi:hypothetical protein
LRNEYQENEAEVSTMSEYDPDETLFRQGMNWFLYTKAGLVTHLAIFLTYLIVVSGQLPDAIEAIIVLGWLGIIGLHNTVIIRRDTEAKEERERASADKKPKHLMELDEDGDLSEITDDADEHAVSRR